MKQYVVTAEKTVSDSMGTTMALLSFSEKAIYACNLGDSRIYRHFQGKLQPDIHRPCHWRENAGKSPSDTVSGLSGRKYGSGAVYCGNRISDREAVI